MNTVWCFCQCTVFFPLSINYILLESTVVSLIVNVMAIVIFVVKVMLVSSVTAIKKGQREYKMTKQRSIVFPVSFDNSRRFLETKSLPGLQSGVTTIGQGTYIAEGILLGLFVSDHNLFFHSICRLLCTNYASTLSGSGQEVKKERLWNTVFSFRKRVEDVGSAGWCPHLGPCF